ncbi:MAG TPA: hypothetical protein VGE74_13770 [Gemmata sp.]
MQVSITRTKGGKTHHAVSVDAKLGSGPGGRGTVTGTGAVTEWTEDPARAGRFPEEVAKHVAARYNGRANAGALTFRDERGKVLAETEAPEPKGAPGSALDAMTPRMAELEAERDEFRKQAKVLGEEVERLRAEIADLKKKLEEAAKKK